MTGRLEGKVALITGSAKGIGAAEARLFAAEGARLVLGDIDEGGLNVLATELTDAGHDVLVQPFDVSQEDQWRSVAKATAGAFGALNVLLNNAGIVDQAGIETTSLVSWDRVIAVNQTGTWLGMKTCVPLMRRSGGGSIINTSSILGIVGAASAAAYGEYMAEQPSPDAVASHVSVGIAPCTAVQHCTHQRDHIERQDP